MNLVDMQLQKKNNAINPDDLASLFVIFGGTGDLTHRKLIPAIYNLHYEGRLPEHFAVVAIGRRDKTQEEYSNDLYQAVKTHSRFQMDDEVWASLVTRIYYYQMDFTDEATYPSLKGKLEELQQVHHTKGNQIFYLAVAPEYFEPIVKNLKQHLLDRSKERWQRVVIEKPFGRDLKTAIALNETIVDAFSEENTYRIDHYLGKEMLQNLLVIRFGNILFEPLWNKEYIEQIQLSSSETLGVEKRGPYYEQSGAIRDMVQSHMLQMLSLIAMERPSNLSPEAIRDAKVEVLKQLKRLDREAIRENVVRGQYDQSHDGSLPSYRSEERVSPTSNTETFVAMKLEVENERWKGVPFYIRTGKRMPKKSTEVIIQFKEAKTNLYQGLHNLQPNLLVIRVQPQEGVFLQFNAKKPGNEDVIVPVQMDFCQNCQVGINSPEAYERLLYDVMKGDQTLFARWDEVYESWKYIDTILDVWNNEEPNFPNYRSGTYGPKAADELLERDGRKWLNIHEPWSI